jgi:ABC-type transport system substrate-binding protein
MQTAFHSEAFLGWSPQDPWFDAQMEAAYAEIDDAKRAELQREIGQWLYDSRKIIPICYYGALYANGPRVKEWPIYGGPTRRASNLEYVQLTDEAYAD